MIEKGTVGVADFTQSYCIFHGSTHNSRKMVAAKPSEIFDEDKYVQGILDAFEMWNWRDLNAWNTPSEDMFDLRNIGLACKKLSYKLKV